jgi:tellurite resistance protein
VSAPARSASPWLARIPPGLFAVPVGLYGLAGAWRRSVGFGWPVADDIAWPLAWTATLTMAVLLVLYVAKALRHPRAIGAEYAHPVPGSLLALIPLSMLLASIWFCEPRSVGWLAWVLCALALQGIVALRVVSTLATGAMPPAAVTPALYLPPVAGGFVGAMALASLGYPGWAALLFGMGLAGWALLEVRVLNSLFEGPMPEALRPTIGVELAPPSVATLAAGTIWPALPGEVLIVGLGIAAGPVVAVMARYHWWSRVPFSVGFWSFSFPLAALAGAVVEVVRRGGWPPVVGGIALLIASAVIAWLAVRTLVLLVNGRLLPPAAPAPTAAPSPPA